MCLLLMGIFVNISLVNQQKSLRGGLTVVMNDPGLLERQHAV